MAAETGETETKSPTQRREQLAQLQDDVRTKFEAGGNATEIVESFSDQLDDLLRSMLNQSLAEAALDSESGFCVIAVGGNGRRRPTPWSDVDLLLVTSPRMEAQIEPASSNFVRDCWDAGLQLGHSVRTPDDVVRFAIEDVQFATSLVDMRFLFGDQALFSSVNDDVQNRVFRDPVDRFVDACVESRREEWRTRGDCVNHLEPDLKKSPGGLRDLHLIRWMSHARFGDSHPATLLENNAVSTEELALLQSSDDFLTKLRLDLHCRTGKKQDLMTRDLQIEIVRSQGVTDEDPRPAVVEFMRDYFGRTSRLSEIARRVTETPHRPTLFERIRSALLPSRDPDGFVINEGTITATPEFCTKMRRNPENVMQAFSTAAQNKLQLSAPLRKLIAKVARKLPEEPSLKSCSLFRNVLRSGHGLPLTLRAMFETNVLDWMIPPVTEIRYLMQFNHYHSYTVDEHTLKTIDEVVAFADEDSPVGSAYNNVRHKATLHCSLILHDIAKGRDGDHSILGEGVAEEIGVRLQTAENKKRMMMFLVRHHLVMPDLAFRRDTTDQSLLVDFARLVGAPELLRMLYVLSVADIKAVAPDAWNDWRGDLLAELYNRTMTILSGRPIKHLERERLELVQKHVRGVILPESEQGENDDLPAGLPMWIDRQLDALPTFYLMVEDPNRIASDLGCIQQLAASGCHIEGAYDADTDTVAYRIFAGALHEVGCFHKIAGVLAGLRMNIMAAQLCTTTENTVIAAFVVTDNDFIGDVPDSRIDEVGTAINDVLTGKTTVDHIFSRSGLFRLSKPKPIIAPREPHISIDNDVSESHTVIDVFANDSPGLLYTLALTLHQHKLSVKLTRIATNVDQVVDVFYVVDHEGNKIESQEQLQNLQSDLMHELYELRKQFEE